MSYKWNLGGAAVSLVGHVTWRSTARRETLLTSTTERTNGPRAPTSHTHTHPSRPSYSNSLSRLPAYLKRDTFDVTAFSNMSSDGPSISARKAAVDRGRVAFHAQRHKHAIAHFSKVRLVSWLQVLLRLTHSGYKFVSLHQLPKWRPGEVRLQEL